MLTSLEIGLEIAYVPVLKYKNKGDILEEESSEKVEDNLGSVITGDYEDEKEEANTEGSDKGDGEPDKRSSKSKSKTNK